MHDKLAKIQRTLKAPKNQFNSFGKYKYRSCEDILEATKPLLDGLSLIINDEVVMIGDRYYVKATATITDGTNKIESSAYAREEQEKKGMDGAQVTGAASSYARKYALNGLFAIDDSKDVDTHEAPEEIAVDPVLIEKINEAKNVADLTELCKTSTSGKTPAYKIAVLSYYNARKSALGGEL